jgi:hypothetical protein
MTRHDLAVASFWSERPLIQRFIADTGRSSFSLRELLAYAEALPDAAFLALQTSGPAVRSNRPDPRAQGDDPKARGRVIVPFRVAAKQST